MKATIDFNEGAALARVKVLEKEIGVVARTISQEDSIEDEDDFKVVADLLVRTVIKRKEVDDLYKEQHDQFMANVQRIVDQVDGWFAESRTKVKEAEDYFRKALSHYAARINAQAHELRVKAVAQKSEAKSQALFKQADELVLPKVPGVSVTPKARARIFDSSAIPAEYLIQVPDENAILAALKAGKKVTGAELDIDYGIRVTPAQAKLGAQ